MANDPLRFDTVDVFTAARYAGNQLAIVHVPRGRSLSQEQKHKIAIEFGYSESVFIHEESGTEQEPRWKINIFTTQGEIPLAGHPVIGTAWLLGKTSKQKLSKGTLVPGAGATPFALTWSNTGICEPTVRIPQTLHKHAESISIRDLVDAQPSLKQHTDFGGRGAYPIVSLVKGMTFILVELESFEALGKVKRGLATPPAILDQGWEPSLIGWYFYYIESQALRPVKIHCRMVEDEIGEDAATGSAACTLTGFLSQQARKEGHEGRDLEYLVIQGEHMGRRSVIKTKVSVREDGKIESMELSGTAVHVMSGILSESDPEP